ncbi:unnamed protein product [Rotaria sordida]|uniref:Uncharacterized protein n=2 Tax=Rotaria sordida TaxID=392033 RepID=A0A815B6S1_9BILA|nr:unnamed protein product [Rotaria sordida]
MQYKQEGEKVGMINTSWIPVSKPLSSTEDPEVQRTRKILLIILGVCLNVSLDNDRFAYAENFHVFTVENVMACSLEDL